MFDNFYIDPIAAESGKVLFSLTRPAARRPPRPVHTRPHREAALVLPGPHPGRRRSAACRPDCRRREGTGLWVERPGSARRPQRAVPVAVSVSGPHEQCGGLEAGARPGGEPLAPPRRGPAVDRFDLGGNDRRIRAEELTIGTRLSLMRLPNRIMIRCRVFTRRPRSRWRSSGRQPHSGLPRPRLPVPIP